MDTLRIMIGSKNVSSWSLRARLALEATGAPFDEVVVPPGQPETRAEILVCSPSGELPVLRHGLLTGACADDRLDDQP